MESARARRPSWRTWRQGCDDDRIQEQGSRSGHGRAQDHSPAVDDDCVSYFPDGTVNGRWPMTTPSFAFPVRLSEKYRPRKVGEFVGLSKAKRVLAKFAANPYACSFLFFGPPGVGKTSIAMAMAQEMGAQFHHLRSQKRNLDNLETVSRI